MSYSSWRLKGEISGVWRCCVSEYRLQERLLLAMNEANECCKWLLHIKSVVQCSLYLSAPTLIFHSCSHAFPYKDAQKLSVWPPTSFLTCPTSFCLCSDLSTTRRNTHVKHLLDVQLIVDTVPQDVLVLPYKGDVSVGQIHPWFLQGRERSQA